MRSLISRRLLTAIGAMTLLWGGAPPAHALERFGPDSVELADADPLDAIVAIQSVFEANYGQWCMVHATGMRLRFECSGSPSPARHGETIGQFLYRDFPEVGITTSPPLLNLYDGHSRQPAHQPLVLRSPIEARRQLGRAWVVLAHHRPISRPDTDIQSAAPVDAARLEDLRRVQVQVEAAIRANRTIDAARLYRDTLRAAPAAPDARAVQDRIYEWEAAMGPSVQ